jgi:hypothetical protein
LVSFSFPHFLGDYLLSKNPDVEDDSELVESDTQPQLPSDLEDDPTVDSMISFIGAVHDRPQVPQD